MARFTITRNGPADVLLTLTSLTSNQEEAYQQGQCTKTGDGKWKLVAEGEAPLFFSSMANVRAHGRECAGHPGRRGKAADTPTPIAFNLWSKDTEAYRQEQIAAGLEEEPLPEAVERALIRGIGRRTIRDLERAENAQGDETVRGIASVQGVNSYVWPEDPMDLNGTAWIAAGEAA